jgi:NADPH-dependent curcumin reductase CurA
VNSSSDALGARRVAEAQEDIVDGLENAPEAFLGMLDGKNFGKLLVPVS